MKGYALIHRKFSESHLWLSEKFTRGQAWVDMILLANSEDGFIRSNGMKIIIERGQLGWSEIRLSARWGWSRGKVRRFLNELETVQQIVQQKNTRSSIITIVNYETYQDDDTTDGHVIEQQTDTNKDIDIVKTLSGKKDSLNQLPLVLSDSESQNINGYHFDDFYKLFPVHKSKRAAEKAYKKAIKDKRGTHDEIMAGVDRLWIEINEGRQDRIYVQYPSTWLNADGWKNEYEPENREPLF